jgi:hypothetical protein
MAPLVGGRIFDGLKVFSATMPAQRAQLGEAVTAWLQAHPDCNPVNAVVRQSSDASFHCLSILIFWRAAAERA